MNSVATIPVLDEASVAVAREAVRDLGRSVGLDRRAIEALATAVSELGHNQLAHARSGDISVRRVVRGGVAGLEVCARDEGPGIADPVSALMGSGVSRRGLGIGLAGVLRLTDEVDFDVRLGEGTRVVARIFSSPPPPTREVAILGRAAPGETVSGDDAFFERRDDGLVLALADGVGHGPLAREASARAIELLRMTPPHLPADYFDPLESALVGTRGCALAVARIVDDELENASFGNVMTAVCGLDHLQRLGARAGVVGGGAKPLGPKDPRTHPRPRSEILPIPRMGAVVMFTDGLTDRLSRTGLPRGLDRHPLIVAHELLTELGRGHDDATVLVAR